MLGARPYQLLDDDGDIDDALAWVSILALFDEMTITERANFIYHVGCWVRDVRDDELAHLRFHEETVRRALALEWPATRQWRLVDADDGMRVIG